MTHPPICPDFICGADKATADERPGGKGDKQIIKVPGAKANVKVFPIEITCETEGFCKEKIEVGPHPSLVTLHGVGAVQPPTDTPTTGLPENG